MPDSAAPDGASQIDVVRARREDLDDLVQIAHAHRAYYGAYVALEDVSAAALRSRIDAALFGPGSIAAALIARCGSAPEGALYFTLVFPNADYRPGLFVKDLFVRPAARGRGVGRALALAAVAEAKACGGDRVELHVAPDNEGARRFYEREGFDLLERLVYRRAP